MRLTTAVILITGLTYWVWCAEPPLDDFHYKDQATAAKAWKPMGGTASPRTGTVADRDALLLPCNFDGTRIERASWDREIKFSLAGHRGISFDIWCRDPGPISSMVIYLQSGKGWYTANFALPEAGRWGTIKIDKEDMGTEGTPAGWNEIQTIRLSAWRGGNTNTELAIRDLRRIEDSGNIYIVRNESALATHPGDAASIHAYPRDIAGQLRKLGLDYSLVSDLDLPNRDMSRAKLVILPYTSQFLPEALRTLEKYVAGGGKIIVFYTLSGDLGKVIGIQPGSHRPANPAGQFSQIRAAGDAPRGMPDVVRQHSWNIVSARPIAEHAAHPRVVAWWHNEKGKLTGEPAVILSDRGALMTHVLLTDDSENQQRLLLSLAGALSPEIWKDVSKSAIGNIGKIGPYYLHGRLGEFAKHDEQTRELGQRFRKIENELISGAVADPLAVMDQARQANRILLEMYGRSCPGAAGEFRGWWCHNALGPGGTMDWDPAIKTLADNGCTAIFPNMLWGGVAFYKSAVLPEMPAVKDKGDQIKLCLAACRKYGVECHVWKVNFNMGQHVPKDFAAKMKEQKRTQVHFDGSAHDGWLCPSHPDNQKLEIDSMVEVAANYAVDGIHFDYLRYPDESTCFCQGCRERFEKKTGRKIDDWPGAIRKSDELLQQWNQFRCDNITTVVEAVSTRAHKVRPGIKVSAAVFPNGAIDRQRIAQDWKLWCERGWLDFVCPMDYTAHDTAFATLVRNQCAWAGKVPVYPGIGLSVWPQKNDAVGLAEKVQIARKAGCKGFMVFEFSPDQAVQVMPMMKLGLTHQR